MTWHVRGAGALTGLAAVVIALSGCSSDDDGGDAAGSSPPPEMPSVSAGSAGSATPSAASPSAAVSAPTDLAPQASDAQVCDAVDRAVAPVNKAVSDLQDSRISAAEAGTVLEPAEAQIRGLVTSGIDAGAINQPQFLAGLVLAQSAGALAEAAGAQAGVEQAGVEQAASAYRTALSDFRRLCERGQP